MRRLHSTVERMLVLAEEPDERHDHTVHLREFIQRNLGLHSVTITH